MVSVADLMAQKAAIEQKIADAQREEKSSAVAQVKALMAQHGLSIADLSARAPAAPKSGGRKPSGKVAPKFRDPATGNTWTGRGLKPNWLKNALANGKSLQDFAI